MALTRWKPWQEIDRMLEHFPSLSGYSFDLSADVSEDDKNVIVKMHLPGIDPDKVHINVEDTHLHISGSREEKQESKSAHYYHREIRYGNFERIIQLPCKVSRENIKAECEDGVLTVTLPKEEGKQPQKIKVTRKNSNHNR